MSRLQRFDVSALLNFHVRTSVRWPVMAAAAAMAGESKCECGLRGPGGSSKLRLLVDAQRVRRELKMSGFMPRHIEQPGSRHSEAGGFECCVEAFFFGLAFDRLRAGDNHCAHRRRNVITINDFRGGAKVFDAAVGAGAEEDRVDLDVFNIGVGFEAHVFEGAFERFAVGFVGGAFERGDGAVDGGDHAGRRDPR